MADQLSFLAGHLIDAVRVNAVSQRTIDGQLGWEKRRKPGMDAVIWCGNLFLKISRSRIWMFPNCQTWVQWEIDSFQQLYGDRVQWQRVGDRGFWVAAVPGTSLLQWLEQGPLTILMMQAAGQIFRQAHGCHSEFWRSGWSHGDSHLANVLYDPATATAALIDFETQHWRQLSPEVRQADDLLIFLLDIIGRCENWAELLPAFFHSYDQPAVLHQLQSHLVVPQGWERLLWATRCNYLSTRELRSRLTHIRTVILA
jgi:hypothetical protein